MNEKVNYDIRDANALDETIGRNEVSLTEKGFPAENRTTLQELIADLIMKEKGQNKQTKILEDLTAGQEVVVSEATSIIQKTRDSAKSAYVDDTRNLKQFNIGKRIPNALGGLRSECELLGQIVSERSAVLLKSGLLQADITALNNMPAKLNAIDKAQEDAKKLRLTTTLSRDEADKKLKQIKTKIRNFVKAAFQEDEEMLVQFKPIPKGRGGSNDGGDDTPPPNPPAQ